VPIWGEGYVKTFLDYSLPTQLAPDNIPLLDKSVEHSYCIYTTRSDYEHIADAAVFHALQRAISVTVEYIDAELASTRRVSADAKYQIKSNCYRHALQRASERGAAVVALNADILLANGFVRTCVNLLYGGKRIIEVPGPRGLRDPIGETLISRYRASDGVSLVIDPVELSAVWMKHLHPLLRMHFVEGVEGAAFHPSHLYWAVGEEGIVARCFHLYPIVVFPRRNTSVNFSTTIDDDLVANLGLPSDEIFVAQDSREIFCCELSPPEHYVGDIARRGDVGRYVEFFMNHGKHNIGNLEKEILISGAEDLSAQWRGRRKQSARFAHKLIKKYQKANRARDTMARRQRRLASLKRLIPAPVKAVLKRVRATIREHGSRSQ